MRSPSIKESLPSDGSCVPVRDVSGEGGENDRKEEKKRNNNGVHLSLGIPSRFVVRSGFKVVRPVVILRG